MSQSARGNLDSYRKICFVMYFNGSQAEQLNSHSDSLKNGKGICFSYSEQTDC